MSPHSRVGDTILVLLNILTLCLAATSEDAQRNTTVLLRQSQQIISDAAAPVAAASESGCSYVLATATFWPGPYEVTRTDSTICRSLRSKSIKQYGLPRYVPTLKFQRPPCHFEYMPRQPSQMVLASMKTQHSRQAALMMTPVVSQSAQAWLPNAARNGSSGLLRTAT